MSIQSQCEISLGKPALPVDDVAEKERERERERGEHETQRTANTKLYK